MPEAVVILCGSFSPLTHLHLHVLSSARIEALRRGYHVGSARLSPVHDAYAKPGLLSSHHRLAMLRLGAPEWAQVDDWEIQQALPSRSHQVVERIKSEVHPKNILVVFACGADLLLSMARCIGWTKESVGGLLDVAVLAVVSRPQVELEEILSSEVFRCRRDRVWVVDADESTVSSTLLRERVRVGESIQGLTPDAVVDYIHRERLFLD